MTEDDLAAIMSFCQLLVSWGYCRFIIETPLIQYTQLT